MHGFSKQQEDVTKDLTGMTEIHLLPDIQRERIVAVMRFRRDTRRSGGFGMSGAESTAHGFIKSTRKDRNLFIAGCGLDLRGPQIIEFLQDLNLFFVR